MDWGFNHSDAVIVLLYKPCFCWLIKVNDHTHIGVTSLQQIRNPCQQYSSNNFSSAVEQFSTSIQYYFAYASKDHSCLSRCHIKVRAQHHQLYSFPPYPFPEPFTSKILSFMLCILCLEMVKQIKGEKKSLKRIKYENF